MARNCQQVIRNVEIKAIYVGELARLARDLGTNMKWVKSLMDAVQLKTLTRVLSPFWSM